MKSGERKQYVPVFVGSTYEDLKEYRTAVMEALHRLETIVRGMEYFGSKPGTPKEECLKAVRSCKVYIGIFAMRYGSIDEESGKSMTHLEFEEAQRLNLPTLVYMLDENQQPVLPIYVDMGDKGRLLKELKDDLKKKYVVSFFTSPEDLAKRITQDLPPVLQGIGVHVELEPEAIVKEDSTEILKRFRVRPAKYGGREVTLRCRIEGEARATDEDECIALKLPMGDAIERRVEPLTGEPPISWLIATREIADAFEELSVGTEVKVRVKLLWGRKRSVDWTEDGPVTSMASVSGYQVTQLSTPTKRDEG